MKNRRLRRLLTHQLRNPILWTGLILACFFVLLLLNQMESIIENFRPTEEVAAPAIDLTAPQELLFPTDASGPTDDVHPSKKDGEVQRRVYPYSVVDGGVHSVQELRSAIGRDPVVARHYSNFRLDRARVVEAGAGGEFHVSYRMGDEIFWTKKRLKVAKSERLITDGTTFTRTRCANVLSDVIPGKTSPDEPAPGVFDTPSPSSHRTSFSPPALVGGGPPATTEPTSFDPPGTIGGGPPATGMPPSGSIIPPPVRDGGSPGPGGGNSPDPVPLTLPVSGPGSDLGPGPNSVPVPEPATLLLFLSGLLGLAGYARRKFLKK